MHGRFLVVGGYREAAVGNCQRLPPCPTEPTPAGFRNYPMLARAEPPEMVAAPLLPGKRKKKKVIV